jgi:hypothetical protein
MTSDEAREFDRLNRENADLRRVLAAVKQFLSDCPHCRVVSKAIRDDGMSDYDIERMMNRQFPSE